MLLVGPAAAPIVCDIKREAQLELLLILQNKDMPKMTFGPALHLVCSWSEQVMQFQTRQKNTAQIYFTFTNKSTDGTATASILYALKS